MTAGQAIYWTGPWLKNLAELRTAAAVDSNAGGANVSYEYIDGDGRRVPEYVATRISCA